MHCLYACFVFIVFPPSLCSVVQRPMPMPPVIDYVVDDRSPFYRASRQAEPLPLSHISPTVLYLSVALGICCYYDSVLFQLHSLSLSPLDYLSDILCSLCKYVMQQWTLRFVSQ